MNKLNGRKVTNAALHATLEIPGVANFKNRLSSIATPTNKAVDMTIEDRTLLVRYGTVEIAVPLTNVSYMILEPEKSK